MQCLEKYLQNFSNVRKALLPVVDGLKEGTDEAGGGHALQVHGRVVQTLQNVIHRAQHVATVLRALGVSHHGELHAGPRLLHLLHSLPATQSP